MHPARQSRREGPREGVPGPARSPVQAQCHAAEILLAIAGAGYSNYWTLFPFSGSVHLGDADEINEPPIDPRLFLADFDLSTLAAAGRFTEKFWLSEPIKTQASVAGPVGVDLATDEQWQAHLRDTGR